MNFDFTVIGGGSAGYAAARTAAALGLRTAVIEGGAEVGGLCILRGCMPSKTLIESGNRFLTLRHAREFGLRAGDIGFDGKEIIARKRRLIGEFADYRREQLEAGKFTFLRGAATFTDPHTLAVTSLEGTETTVASRTFLIATGSAINTPPIPGLAESGCLTSDDVLDLEEIPGSVVVLGAGPVALELAHYFAALDRKVTVVQRSRQLLTGVDPDVAGVVESAFRRRGAEVFTGTRLLRVEREGALRRVVFEHEGAEKSVEAAAVLNALGRKPRTARLGLDSAGVELRGHTVKTNLHQQTTAAHIFAAGDCCGPFEVVHTAIEQGELAARNAARVLQNDDALASIDYRLKLYAVFTEPQVASVGLSETEARARGLDFLTATYPFNDHGKSLVMGETEGFVKLIADKSTREIVGGSVVGPHASDLIHEIVVAMRFRATAGQLATTPHYHPTLSEIWTYPAEELAEGA
jgi:pyruvate/2-oxoglutarate dehydrogenase complex dihydrolipoamide dehydrogenase (E3) component